jgi:phosphoserine phosphatase
MKALKYYGYKTAILSGGLPSLVNTCKKRIRLIMFMQNELEIIDGKLNQGKRILKTQKKRRHPHQSNDCRRDGANDLPMLNLAGLGIAFSCAKLTVKESAESSISSLGLDGVLYLLGYHDRHIDMMEM